MTAGAGRESRRTLDRLRERLRAELELLRESGGQIEVVLEIGAHPIGAQRGLRQLGELVRERARRGQGLPGRNDAVDEADRERLVRRNGATGEDQVERAREAD